jgi:hypothetical protein
MANLLPEDRQVGEQQEVEQEEEQQGHPLAAQQQTHQPNTHADAFAIENCWTIQCNEREAESVNIAKAGEYNSTSFKMSAQESNEKCLVWRHTDLNLKNTDRL